MEKEKLILQRYPSPKIKVHEGALFIPWKEHVN